jgi:hypothetical protein
VKLDGEAQIAAVVWTWWIWYGRIMRHDGLRKVDC